MTDSSGKSRTDRVSGGPLLRAARGYRRKADLEEHLRSAVASEGLAELYDPQLQKLKDAIREVAIPALDEIQRVTESTRSIEINVPRVMMSDGLRSRGGMLEPSPKPHISEKKAFHLSDDYCWIEFEEIRYQLTKQAAEIVKMLHEAHCAQRVGVSVRQIQNKTKCGKVWDSFRRRKEGAFWAKLIEKVE